MIVVDDENTTSGADVLLKMKETRASYSDTKSTRPVDAKTWANQACIFGGRVSSLRSGGSVCRPTVDLRVIELSAGFARK